MLFTNPESPVEDRLLDGRVGRLAFDTLANLLVDAGHAYEEGWMNGLHRRRQLIEFRAVGDDLSHGHSSVIDMPLKDMRERQIRDEAVFRSQAEVRHGKADIVGEVAVRELHAFGLAGGARGVDDGADLFRFGVAEASVEGGVACLLLLSGIFQLAEAGGVVEGPFVHNEDVGEGGEIAGLREFVVLLF